MKKTLLILVILGTVSCNVKQTSQIDNVVVTKKNIVNPMNLYPELAKRIDKTESTPLDNYFKLTIATDSTCNVEWGNKMIKRKTNANYNFSIARRFWLDWENDKFLALRAGMGTGAWFSLFLPLDSVNQEWTIDNTLIRDKKRSLVVAEQFPGTDTIMYIVNLTTGATQFITDGQKCTTFHHLCLDTVALTESNLYYRWSTPNKYDNLKTVERIVKITI